MLHTLIEYADRRGLVTEPGFKPKWVRWLLVFNRDGEFLNVHDLAGGEKNKRGRLFEACPDLTQPEMVAAGRGTRHFLVDALDKVVLLTKDDEVSKKLSGEHTYFVNLLRQASSEVSILTSIADWLDDDGQLQAIRHNLNERKAKPTEAVTFAIHDSADGSVDVIVEQNMWHDWWRQFRQELAAAREAKTKKAAAATSSMLCLLSGKETSPVLTHPKITGLSDVGGLSMGDALTSFDKEAFGSFDLTQGQNAALSHEMAAKYTGALNDLIQNRSKRLAGLKVAYWYSEDLPAEYDVVAEILEGIELPDAQQEDEASAEDVDPHRAARAESKAGKLLDAIRNGEKPELLDARFYAVTLSGNAGRVMIRDWMEGTFESVAEAAKQWFDDLAVVSRDGKSIIRTFKFFAVVGACVRDLKEASLPLQTAIWHAAMKNQPIPHQVMAQVLNRVRLDVVKNESPRHARLGLLKAYLKRRGFPMTEELNEHQMQPAYLCGRILALLGRIQREALGDVGAGVVQRYYAAASATPALVLGRLVRTAQTGHLPKIKGGLRYWYEQQIAEVWSKLEQAPPATLTLEEQTLFAMGYYQQQAKRAANDTDAVVDEQES